MFSFIPKYFARIFEMNTKSPTQMNTKIHSLITM